MRAMSADVRPCPAMSIIVRKCPGMTGESRDIDMVRKVRETMRAVRQGGPSHVRWRCRVVAVQLSVKVDERSFKAAAYANAKEWAKAMEYATKDMRRAAPPIVKRYVTEAYNIKAGEVTVGSKKAVGSCSMSGGITDMTLEYKGRMLTPTHFGMRPGAWPGPGETYTITAKILRNRGKVQIGHWRRPWSEGGKHGKSSPAMLLNGKVPPIMREGNRYKALKVVSMPQMVDMVVNRDEHVAGAYEELQDKQMEILRKRLSALGIEV